MEVHQVSNNPYLDELEKIANQLVFEEPMNPDAQPVASEEDVAESQNEVQEEVVPEEAISDEEAQLQAEILQQQEQEEQYPQGVNEGAEVEEQMQAEIPQQEASPMEDGSAVATAEAAAELAGEETVLADNNVAENIAQRQELENAVIQEVVPNMSDEELEQVLVSKVASEMTSLGTIAKLVECSKADADSITSEMQKEATELIEYMVTSEEAFYEGMERVSSQLFQSDEAQAELFSRDGLIFTFEQLATFDEDGFDKQADEGPNALQKLKAFAGEAVETTKAKLGEALYSVKNLKHIGEDLQATSAQLREYDNLLGSVSLEPGVDDILTFNDRAVTTEARNSLQHSVDMLDSQRRLGKSVLYGGGGAALAGGALYGGKKLYDHLHEDGNEEKVAGVLPDTFQGGTLNVATETELNGGIQKMSKQLVTDFLKVAGVAGLVSIAQDETLDENLRKEASDRFDEIAVLGNTAMTNEFVKVAQEIYSEEDLHEIVAGKHTDHLFDKVASFVSATESSIDELEKTANAGGVAAIKAVGAGLKESAGNIANSVGQAKAKAEGAGREYIGVLADHKGAAGLSHGATGLAGGGLIAGAMAGYNAINNPAEYDIEQTAAALEEAMLTKQAAIETYTQADAFIRQYGHIINQ